MMASYSDMTVCAGTETESFEWYDLDNPADGEIEFSILKNLSSIPCLA